MIFNIIYCIVAIIVISTLLVFFKKSGEDKMNDFESIPRVPGIQTYPAEFYSITDEKFFHDAQQAWNHLFYFRSTYNITKDTYGDRNESKDIILKHTKGYIEQWKELENNEIVLPILDTLTDIRMRQTAYTLWVDNVRFRQKINELYIHKTTTEEDVIKAIGWIIAITAAQGDDPQIYVYDINKERA